ncbi:MAG: 3-oxoacyl-[acyl-carrier-protein] reductase [Deltaproteobacteria bacterium]|nr:MAG: 3-oxoacyl-[acyl-carrier-protein] reductase [Deltaproteobacteria bacterium]
MEFKDKLAVVTGASRGIGRAIGDALTRRGAMVIENDILDFNGKKCKIGASGEDFYRFDVSRSQDTKKAFEKILKKHGRIDFLVNNAGITRDCLLLRMKDEDWERVIEVNLKGTFNCTRAVLGSMIKNRYGKIVNICSVVGLTGNPGQANYAASKAGIIGFTKAVAREVASRNININAVAPGFIETEMTYKLSPAVRQQLKKQIPLGRFGKSEDVAEVVCFLLSEAADYITGQVIQINGGMYM